MVKKGDTLIEVMLAVGIFSMIAISIVAVMSNGVSGAQTALETTLAREEIDTQAEALRFIQASYIAEKENQDSKFRDLWKDITKNAIIFSNGGDDEEKVLRYRPSACSDLYNNETSDGIYQQRAFVINPKSLGAFISGKADVSDVLIKSDTNKLTQAQIYPRLIYQNEGRLIDSTSEVLERAEGIYVVAVRDNETTRVGGRNNTKTAAFYDFYIRTCWYGSNANDPTTISTVIRLYDPDVVISN